MNSRPLLKLVAFTVLFISLSVYLSHRVKPGFTSFENIEEHNADECPHLPFDADEQAFYDQISSDKLSEIRIKSTSLVDVYAGGKLRGLWKAKEFLVPQQINYGYRTIASTYDKEKDIFYVVSAAGHIWRIDYDTADPSLTQWTSMNHSHAFMSVARKEWFDNINYGVDNSMSRLLRSYNDELEYSDDEGRNWILSQGVAFKSTDDQGCVVSSTRGNRAVVLVNISGSYDLVYSYDGITYAASGLSLNASTYEAKLMKPHFSDDVYLVARHKTTSKLSIYKMTSDSEVCTLIQSPTLSIPSPTSVLGTYTGGVYHFYYIQGNNVYYSNDEGASWTKTVVSDYGSTDGNSFVRTVHPTQPSTLFRGYLDVYVSIDRGATFAGWGHKLGWDAHDMKMFQRKDSTYVHLVANDFGVYVSSTPEVKNSYVSINNSAPTQMCYDSEISDNFDYAFTANQDRGSMSFENSPTPTTGDIKTTDGLRVTLAHQEKSIWTWMYYGSLYHQTNPGYGTSGLAGLSIAGNWTAGCMVEHPNSNLDAVVIAHEGNNLRIASFDEDKQSISIDEHPYDFNGVTGSTVSSFGYSLVNRNIWYVAMKNGTFLYSTDGGISFAESSAGKLAVGNDQGYNYQRNQQVIKTSKYDENTVYFAGVKNAFYISTDNGQTFTNHSSGLNVWRIRDFELSEDEKFIFAACAYGGAWVFSVDENQWYQMGGANVPYVDFTSVAYSASKGMVQFGTYGSGLLDFTFETSEDIPLAPTDFKVDEKSFSTVNLSWDIVSDSVDEYIIRRSTDLSIYEDVAVLSVTDSTYIDSLLSPEREYFYKIYALNGGTYSLPSSLVNATTDPMPEMNRSLWSLVYASSESNTGTKAFDGKTTTAWESGESAAYPHELIIDLGGEYKMSTFTYIPDEAGIIKSYVLYASNDTTKWGNSVSEGTWKTREDAMGVNLIDVSSARYVRFVAKEGFDDDKATIAELNFSSYFDTNIDAPVGFNLMRASTNYIYLTWENVSSSIDGSIIERKVGDEFEEIARVSSLQTVYKDEDLAPYTNYQYRITAFRNEDYSEVSNILTVATTSTGLLDRSSWRVSTSSFERGMRGTLSIDNNPDTWWSSPYLTSVTEMPHEFIIDLGEEQTIKAFSYFPPADSVEGMIKEYEFYVSNSTTEWGAIKASGTWTTWERQNVPVVESSGRYVRLVAKSAFDGSSVAAVAEILLWEKYPVVAAIHEEVTSEIKAYPNPFTDHLSVSFGNNTPYTTVQLLSSDGRVLQTQPIDNIDFDIQIERDLSPGIYFLNFQGDSRPLIKKVIKR